MKVAILGHRGMLGARLVAALAPRFHVITYAHRWPERLVDAVEVTDPDWVINAIRGGWSENAELPHAIAARFPGRLIQPSSDAVCEDTDYGRAKAAGEAGIVIRCGIVDPEAGLLARIRTARTWAGHTEGWWNGVTALAFTGIVERVMAGSLTGDLIIPASPAVTGLGLARAAVDVFGWPTTLIGVSGGMDRRLTPTIEMPPIRDQLAAYL